MTIKQYGGVFGRNPTFNDVTIEGELTFDGDIDINSDLNISGDLGVNIGTDTPTTYVEVRTNGSTGNDDFVNLTRATYGNVLSLSRSSGDGVIQADKNLILRCDSGNNQTGANTNIIFQYDGSTESARFDASGNLAFVSGKGIDFSATAGTGTSELLSDFEQGNWTPTYTTSGTDFDSVTYDIQTGSYVKIGELVTVFCAIRTDALTVGSGSGNVRIGGLPFTVGSTADQWNNATALRAGFVDATNFELVSCFGTEAVPRDINNNQAALTDLDTGANDNHFTFTLSYRV